MKARAKRRKVEKSAGIKVGYWNARSIVAAEKQEMVRGLLQTRDIDIMGIVETWFREDARAHQLSVEGYKVILTDLLSFC